MGIVAGLVMAGGLPRTKKAHLDMSAKHLLPLAIAAVVLAGGLRCNMSSPSDGNGGPAPAADAGAATDAGTDAGGTASAAGGLCGAISIRRCEMLQRCRLLEPSDVAKRECVSLFDVLECGPSAWPSRVVAGTLTLDVAGAQACANAWGAQSCDAFSTEPSACSGFLAPVSPLGGACYGGEERECAGGVCRKAGCPKMCQAPGAQGEDCERDADCDVASGLYCLSVRPASYCARFATASQACDADRRCADGLYCTNGYCQARAALGQGCESGGCVDGGFCQSGGSSDGGSCQAQADAGEACGADPHCQAGLLCEDTEKRCVPFGPLPSGAPCRGRQRCEVGATCVGETPNTPGVCEATRDGGESCESSLECDEPYACAPGGGPGQCAARLADTSACARDRDCLLFSRCLQGSCTRVPRLGEPCTDACLMGLCGAPDGGAPDAGKVCSGFGGPSAACQRDSQCASGRCVAGACAAICAP